MSGDTLPVATPSEIDRSLADRLAELGSRCDRLVARLALPTAERRSASVPVAVERRKAATPG